MSRFPLFLLAALLWAAPSPAQVAPARPGKPSVIPSKVVPTPGNPTGYPRDFRRDPASPLYRSPRPRTIHEAGRAARAARKAWATPVHRLKAGPVAPPVPAPMPIIIPSGPNADAGPAIQALTDAVLAANAANPGAGGSYRIPGSPAPYSVGGPIYTDGSNVIRRGDGNGVTRISNGYNYYSGPVFADGIMRLEKIGIDPAQFRPPSVLGGGRLALATVGTTDSAILYATAHAAGLGGALTPTGINPDYYTSPAYTWEFVIGFPVQPQPSAGLFGPINLDNGVGDPWAWRYGSVPNTLEIWFRTADQIPTQFRRYSFPIPPGTDPVTVTATWNAPKAAFYAWVNGKAVPVTANPTDGTTWRPGVLMARHSGIMPFSIGTSGGGYITNQVLHALAITRGEKYVAGQPTEVRFDGKPVNAGRFGEYLYGDVQTIAFMPGTDKPATHVRIDTSMNNGVGFLIPAKAVQPPGNITTRDMTITSSHQSAVEVNATFGETFVDCSLQGGMRGYSSSRLACSYPIVFERCHFSGADTCIYAFEALLTANNSCFDFIGRDGIRGEGGNFKITTSFFGFRMAPCDILMRFVGNGYGCFIEIDNVLDDGEGQPTAICAIEIEQPPYVFGVASIKHVGVAAPAPNFIHLIGHQQAGSSLYQWAKIDVSDISRYDGKGGNAIQIDGDGWYGTFDPNGYPTAAVGGNGRNIQVVPLVTPTITPTAAP